MLCPNHVAREALVAVTVRPAALAGIAKALVIVRLPVAVCIIINAGAVRRHTRIYVRVVVIAILIGIPSVAVIVRTVIAVTIEVGGADYFVAPIIPFVCDLDVIRAGILARHVRHWNGCPVSVCAHVVSIHQVNEDASVVENGNHWHSVPVIQTRAAFESYTGRNGLQVVRRALREERPRAGTDENDIQLRERSSRITVAIFIGTIANYAATVGRDVYEISSGASKCLTPGIPVFVEDSKSTVRYSCIVRRAPAATSLKYHGDEEAQTYQNGVFLSHFTLPPFSKRLNKLLIASLLKMRFTGEEKS